MFPKLSGELHSLLVVSLGFMILDPATIVLKKMQVTIVSSIADDRPGFKADGYTLRGIIDLTTCISLWFAPYICHTIGARLTLILSSFGYLYYIGSYAIEEEWALYSSAAILGIAYGIIIPPKNQYLIEGSKPENVTRNVGICYSLQQIMQIFCNIYVFFAFEGKEYIDQLTRRKVVFGVLGVVALSVITFIFLPKTTKDSSGGPQSFVTTIKKTWNILITPIMLWMCIAIVYFGMQYAFEDGVYSPSIGFTLAFGDSVKELMPLSGISNGVGGLLGFLYSVLLGARLTNRSYARRLLVLCGILGELMAYVITFMNLPDSASLGNTEAKSFVLPNVYLAMLGALLLGFGNACFNAQVYSIIGDNFRENSGESSALCNFISYMSIGLTFYLCGNLGLHTQVSILSVAAVVGFVGCILADCAFSCLKNKNPAEKHPERHS